MLLCMYSECQVIQKRLKEYKQTRPSSLFEPKPICFKQTFTPRAKRNKQLNALSHLASFFLPLDSTKYFPLSFSLGGALHRGPHNMDKIPTLFVEKISTVRNLVLLAKPMTSIHRCKSTLKATKNNIKGWFCLPSVFFHLLVYFRCKLYIFIYI